MSFHVQNAKFLSFLDAKLILDVQAPLISDANLSFRVQGAIFIPINRLSFNF